MKETFEALVADATARIKKAYKKADEPLLELLLHLINMPVLPNGQGGALVKTMHTHVDNLLNFYLTECPENASGDVDDDDMLEIADELLRRGGGVARLLKHLGLASDAQTLREYIKTLADAYTDAAKILNPPKDELCSCNVCGECCEYCRDDCPAKLEQRGDKCDSDDKCDCCTDCDCDCEDCDCCKDAEDDSDEEITDDEVITLARLLGMLELLDELCKTPHSKTASRKAEGKRESR